METKHTPGPWTHEGNNRIGDGSGRGAAIAFTDRRKPGATENARRIVACVNACEGMDDPAAFIVTVRKSNEQRYGEIQTLRAENQRLRDALQGIAPMFDNDGPLLAVYAKEIEQARAALGVAA